MSNFKRTNLGIFFHFPQRHKEHKALLKIQLFYLWLGVFVGDVLILIRLQKSLLLVIFAPLNLL
jgi:hypothetical protein